jgi:sterol 3beta-glucosyltransferase
VEEPDNDMPDEEIEPGDFEVSPLPSMPDKPKTTHLPISDPLPERPAPNIVSPKIASSRSGSMMTVRLQRRASLAEKLKDVFELPGIEEVWAGMQPF